jgi:serine protease Do
MMGFYNTDSERAVKKRGPWNWMGVIVLSALVGSGATFGVTSYMQSQGYSLGSTGSQMNGSVQGVTSVSSKVNVNVNDAITQIVKKTEPDVVAVVNYTSQSNFFNQQSQTQASDIGSGVYFDKDAEYAYVVTNNHVVEGGTKVEIVLQSGQHVQAEVVGTDPYTDLAVIKTPISNFKGVDPAVFGNSDSIQVGEPAIAIGTPMGLDFADSVTSGIVSGKERMMPVEEPTSQQTLAYQSVIQTDAAINPGNSGGPLLNIDGQVIGINSSKIAEQDVSGMGFAIPSNEVEVIASQIMKTGHAVHPALGIGGYSLSSVPQQYWPDVPVDYGVYVDSVDSSDAKAAGLKQGDVIISLNGKAIQTIADLRTALFQTKPGQEVQLTLYRGGKKLNVKIKVGQQDSVNTTASGTAQSGNGNGNDGSGNDGSGSDGGGTGSDPFSGSFGW